MNQPMIMTQQIVITTGINTSTASDKLADVLAHSPYWSERKEAALQLGALGGRQALTALHHALLNDPFWMVRFAVIQALERISSPHSAPALMDAAVGDPMEVIRTYALTALDRMD